MLYDVESVRLERPKQEVSHPLVHFQVYSTKLLNASGIVQQPFNRFYKSTQAMPRVSLYMFESYLFLGLF